MTQLTQLQSGKQITREPYSKGNIHIETEVPAINYVWVKDRFNKFIQENKLLSSLKKAFVRFKNQPVEKNTMRCDAIIKLNNKFFDVSGQGRDEYQTVNDLLQNLELEVLLESTKEKTISNFFLSKYITQFKKGDQYA